MKPYNWLSNKEASFNIPNGEKLQKPLICDDDLWAIIFNCFNKPDERPTFVQLVKQLQHYKQTHKFK